MLPVEVLERTLLSDLEPYLVNPGFMSSDMDLKAIRALALSKSFLKKLQPVGKNDLADSAALKKFLAVNSSISDLPFEFDAKSEQESVFWDYFRDNIRKTLTPGPDEVQFDLEFIRNHFALGPGSSVGANNESFYTKFFNSTLTATSDYLITLFRGAISESDTWSIAEMQRFKKYGFEIVDSDSLFFAPKKAVISRTCCSQPLVNMCMQKALGAFLEMRLEKCFGINLSTQPTYNRILARLGSIDGSFGTIDLESASDSISWRFVQRIMPENLLGFFRLFRCEFTTLPNGEKVRLNMISTMGNGFTFPLQTIIFSCVVRSVYQMMNLGSYCPKTQFCVFGDDIIVRREAYDFVVAMLAKLGFRVNGDKSFNTGSFRESCGEDYWQGELVRPVYIQHWEAVTDVFSAFNRLNRWSALSGIPLKGTIQLLWKAAPKRRVPFSESFDGGFHVPFYLTKPRLNNGYWFTYRKFINVPRKVGVPSSKSESKSLGYDQYNDHGWAITFLGGYARRDDRVSYPENPEDQESFDWSGSFPSASLTLRRHPGERRRLKVVPSSIPYWDWEGPKESALCKFFSYSSWQAAVTGNMRDSAC